MDKKNLTSFDKVFPMLVQKYETFLPPTDETIEDKMNSLITYLNRVGKLNNDVVKQWNNVVAWTMEDGLKVTIEDKVNVLLDNGDLDVIFEDILNENVVSDINKNIESLNTSMMEKAKRSEVREDTNKRPINVREMDTETKQLFTGGAVAVVGENAVGNENVKPKAITPEKTDFVYQSKNMFNKNTAIKGFYVETGSGVLQPNSNYWASDFIPCEPNEAWVRNHIDQVSFYTRNQTYLYLNPTNENFTTPDECYYIRVSVPDELINAYQIEKGLTTTSYEPYQLKIEHLKVTDEKVLTSIENLKSSVNVLNSRAVGYFQNVLRNLNNPFVYTQIKLLGDSITAGVGGTGYSPTGDDISGTGQKANVYSATCWANMLRDNILTSYNKDFYIEIDNPNVINTMNGVFEYDPNAYLKWKFTSLNTTNGKGLKFSFFGDHFSVLYGKTTGTGIVEIWVDNQKIADLDTYGNASYSHEAKYSGLGFGEHIVEIKETGRKNNASASTVIYLEALKIPKSVVVKNWGISGITSQWIYDAKEMLIEDNDNIVIMQIGTNDRSVYNSTSAQKSFLRSIINYGVTKNIDFILMSANPAINENNDLLKFKMIDVNTSISDIAKEYNMSFISNYTHFITYANLKGIELETLIPDGLHPNDLGYKVMYNNIASSLGLPVIKDNN